MQMGQAATQATLNRVRACLAWQAVLSNNEYLKGLACEVLTFPPRLMCHHAYMQWGTGRDRQP